MEETYLNKTSLPDHVVSYLLSHNIRTIGQLISMTHQESGRRIMASALNVDVHTLNSWLKALAEDYPQEEVPEHSGRHYAMGYRL